MRVLVACEFSGIVRDSFAAQGCDAWSCDIEDSEMGGNHFKCDVREILELNWDLMIAHPPCTYLCVSGARWLYEQKDFSIFGVEFEDRTIKQSKAVQFVNDLLNAPIPRIAIENPVGVLSTKIRKPDQIIHPWQFGHAENKSTCLWLKNLPLLSLTEVVEIDRRIDRVHRMAPRKNRSKERSRTYPGIARAMAEQWSGLGGESFGFGLSLDIFS